MAWGDILLSVSPTGTLWQFVEFDETSISDAIHGCSSIFYNEQVCEKGKAMGS